MFKVDHSQATEFEVIKPGEYEVTVVNYELKQAESGNNRVIVDYEIRSDVEQPFQGQKILFDNFTVTDKAMWRFQAASKAAQFPDGMQFGSYKEWADAFLNKALRVVVGEREYNGKKYPQVNGFKVSEVAAPSTSVEVSDDDVPF
ncbi:DUF669 domain-containing protein [Bacillus paramycoides]|uniref:DUF669 domain-containing protein n=1 Tax=Bacillus paramycoides TaxID=2026194 RepID=UPI0040598F9A